MPNRPYCRIFIVINPNGHVARFDRGERLVTDEGKSGTIRVPIRWKTYRVSHCGLSFEDEGYVGPSNLSGQQETSVEPTFSGRNSELVRRAAFFGWDKGAHQKLRPLRIAQPSPEVQPGKFVRVIDQLALNYLSWGDDLPEIV